MLVLGTKHQPDFWTSSLLAVITVHRPPSLLPLRIFTPQDDPAIWPHIFGKKMSSWTAFFGMFACGLQSITQEMLAGCRCMEWMSLIHGIFLLNLYDWPDTSVCALLAALYTVLRNHSLSFQLSNSASELAVISYSLVTIRLTWSRATPMSAEVRYRYSDWWHMRPRNLPFTEKHMRKLKENS